MQVQIQICISLSAKGKSMLKVTTAINGFYTNLFIVLFQTLTSAGSNGGGMIPRQVRTTYWDIGCKGSNYHYKGIHKETYLREAISNSWTYGVFSFLIFTNHGICRSICTSKYLWQNNIELIIKLDKNCPLGTKYVCLDQRLNSLSGSCQLSRCSKSLCFGLNTMACCSVYYVIHTYIHYIISQWQVRRLE